MSKLYDVGPSFLHWDTPLIMIFYVAEDCRIALAACQPTQSLQPQLSAIVKKITETPKVLNKTTLFIKPEDLVDGVVNLSIGTRKRHRDEDTVTKGAVMTQNPHLTCTRCGGPSNVIPGSQPSEVASHLWKIWEKMWTLRCVCGGSWIGGH